MSAGQPVVSVMLPVYNAGRYLAEALDSVLAQTLRDFEIIAIDDGSKDNSLTILQGYAARDERVRVLSRPNRGVIPTRNEALAIARGEFFAAQDADDISLPQRFARQVEYLRAHPAVLAVGTWFEAMDGAGRRLRTYAPPTTHEEIDRLLLKGHAALCQPTYMLRTSAVREIGGFDETLKSAEEVDIALRLAERGRLACLPEVLVRYRIHDASVSVQIREDMHAAAREACSRAWARRGITGEFEPTSPGRHDGTRRGKAAWLLACGWWAFNSGERRTAAIYALKTIAQRPAYSGGYRLLACSLLKSGTGSGEAESFGSPDQANTVHG
jgi:glycosyltransferase involved in cell wall biosynthesis